MRVRGPSGLHDSRLVRRPSRRRGVARWVGPAGAFAVLVGCNAILDNDRAQLAGPATELAPTLPEGDASAPPPATTTDAGAPPPAAPTGDASIPVPPTGGDAGGTGTPPQQTPPGQIPGGSVPPGQGVPPGGNPAPDAGAPPPQDPPPAGCPAGQHACGGACVSVDDPAFGCGSAACTPCAFPNASATCAAGACVMGACAAGRADCNAGAADGCEADLASPATCGACNVACAPADTCAASPGGFVCTPPACPAGQPTRCANECVDTATDLRHCGACGVPCDGVCQAGVCQPAQPPPEPVP